VFSLSRFQQLMKALPGTMVDQAIARHQADRYSKVFSCADQLTAMVYAQLAGVSSLRQLEAGFNSHPSQHYHLGTGPIKRSTLADANRTRPPAVFEELLHGLIAQLHRGARRRMDEALHLLDATSISLKGRGFDDWATPHRTRFSQGLKVHVMADNLHAAPVWQAITAPNVNDVVMAREVPIEAGRTYVFDKGYCDYNWWAKLDASGARFVTRLKRTAAIAVDLSHELDRGAPSILGDHTIRLTNRNPGAGRKNHYTQALRRIEVLPEGHAKSLVLVTNDFERSAEQIAHCYKERWQIELLFKWLKQHLKIRQFMGRSENAARIQLLTALIAYVLLMLYQQASGTVQSLWTFLGSLRASLFQRDRIPDYYQRRRTRALEIKERQGILPV
jgi:putative transposase